MEFGLTNTKTLSIFNNKSSDFLLFTLYIEKTIRYTVYSACYDWSNAFAYINLLHETILIQ